MYTEAELEILAFLDPSIKAKAMRCQMFWHFVAIKCNNSLLRIIGTIKDDRLHKCCVLIQDRKSLDYHIIIYIQLLQFMIWLRIDRKSDTEETVVEWNVAWACSIPEVGDWYSSYLWDCVDQARRSSSLNRLDIELSSECGVTTQLDHLVLILFGIEVDIINFCRVVIINEFFDV